MSTLRIEGPWIKDEHGRTVILRGVNLGGSTKMPAVPDGRTHVREGFYDHRGVSFVGRPFPLAEADAHFKRLKRWGFTFLRFLVTWEAVEHEGPGRYDESYLDYLEAVVRKAGEHGMRLFIDPHQDVWSRFTGGDGAPGWTLEAVGLDPRNMHASGAAIVHAEFGDPFPRMIWPTNGTKLGAATMFSLFFGGDQFAPRTRVDGEPAQSFLQRHYIGAIVKIAERLKRAKAVVGYDTLNEPLAGWIGWRDLRNTGGMLRLGHTPSPFEAMRLGAGESLAVDNWTIDWRGMHPKGRRVANPERRAAWLPGRTCVWRENGVWDYDGAGNARLLRPDHFAHVAGKPVDFENRFFKPFAERYLRAIRRATPDAWIFLETEAAKPPPRYADAPNVVYAPHWYDAVLLVTKRHFGWLGADFRTEKPVFGAKNVRRSFAGQLGQFKKWAESEMGGAPVLLGEFGIPFDLNGAKAFRTGDFHEQTEALDRTFRALEDNLMHGTLWNYTADNTQVHGDGWNGEDLSLYCAEDEHEKGEDAGGRALDAAVRPYPAAVAGEPLAFEYDPKKTRFTFRFKADPALSAPTEIYVPERNFGADYDAVLSRGAYTRDAANQRLIVAAGLAGEVTLTVSKRHR